jgi:3-oxoacyl-(acyl-carrier-protein) synthase
MPSALGLSPAATVAVRCQVAGFAACRFVPDQLPILRQKPGPLRAEPLPPSILKHSDEQTVAGVAAVSRAIAEHGLKDLDYSQWGVIAAPRFFARAKLAVVLSRFAVEGAWGISPHLIPHRSQHALSGTISQALKIHGPNYGVGGGPDSAAEAIMVAGALLADRQLPGVWVVLTGFDPELVPAEEEPGTALTPTLPTSDCLALALALLPLKERQSGLVLSVGAEPAPEPDAEWPVFSLETFVRHLADGRPGPAHWRLRYGGWTTLQHAESAVEICS